MISTSNYRVVAIIHLVLFAAFSIAQDQSVADSFKHVLTFSIANDSVYLANLEGVSFNEQNPKIAKEFADRLILEAKQLGFKEFVLSGYLQKGNADLLQGNLENALGSFFSSIEVAKELKNPAKEGMILGSIADVYSISGNQQNAALYYQQSIAALRQSSDTLSLATALLNAGDEYLNQKEYNLALNNFKESGPLFQKLNYEIGIAYNLGNEGIAHAGLGDSKLAETKINEAIDMLEALQEFYASSVYLTYMSDIYHDKGENQQALKYAKRSLALAEQHGLKDQISESNLKLSDLYDHLGKTKLSFDHYKKYIAYRDSVNNLETVEELANMRTDHEVSEKQLEVNLLESQKKNQLITLIAAFLAALVVAMYAIAYYRRFKYTQRTKEIIEHEKERSEKLLLNILPEETAQELKEKGKVAAKRFESATILFTDFKAFTKYSENLSPVDLVKSIDFYFSKFDEIIEKYDLEKIKTIGDAYFCVGGVPNISKDHPQKIAAAALEIVDFVNAAKDSIDDHLTAFDIRLGINTGPVVAGVVGTKKFAYDIWGDTVNIASRMESSSETGRINISENTYQLIKDEFNCEYRGEFEVKNKGKMKMYYLNGS